MQPYFSTYFQPKNNIYMVPLMLPKLYFFFFFFCFYLFLYFWKNSLTIISAWMSNLCWYVNINPTWVAAAVVPAILQKGLILNNRYFQILLINTILTIMKIFEEYLQIWKSLGSARIEPWITRLEAGHLDHCATGISPSWQAFKLFIVNIGFRLQCQYDYNINNNGPN